ncbi:hypothetical protein TNIN_235581, partial [Trichonephila inaurata madagascariensis]
THGDLSAKTTFRNGLETNEAIDSVTGMKRNKFLAL